MSEYSSVGPRHRGAAQAAPPSASTRRVITVPSTFRKCPQCPTIFLDHLQLAQHLAQLHRDHQQERQCLRCQKHFVTYEDHTACEPCLHTLRHNVVPNKMTPEDTRHADSCLSTEMECGHCHQSFKSRALAELHCLSTGHDMERVTDTVNEKPKHEEGSKTTMKAEKSKDVSDLPGPASGVDPSANNNSYRSSSSKICQKTASKTSDSHLRRGRKRRLIRKNQTACEVCGDECGSVSSLYAHLRSSHPELFPFPCGVCERRFSLEASAREHERRHAFGELQCPACPLRFSRMSHLHHHTVHHHPDFTNFPCQYCGAVSPTVDALHSHIKIHHGDRLGLPASFTCEVCQETFHTGKALARHRFSRHPGTAECNICGAQVGRRYLSKHINAVHTKEKIHKCDQCDKDFYSRTSLTGHQKRQHGPRKHLCHLCGKGYVHNVELQRHLKAHRNQRDFKCDFCGRSFLKAVDLTYHRRSHTGERPHQCRLCPEAFIKPLGLRKHMLKHTTVKKVKRLKYSKKKIDELTSSVIEPDEEEVEGGVNTTPNLDHAQPSPQDLPDAQHLTQPIHGFPDPTAVPSPQPQPELQHLAPTDLQVQQLSVTDLDGNHLEGQLQLSQVVDDLSSGELLEMGPGLLLEATDVRGGHQGVVESGDVDEAKGGNEATENEVGQQSQPVQVIYVHFMDAAL
ncbi:Zinc finger protein 596 [Portunus trituberculatus]|uniref:Zinc finger protein 596 n=1 Tax=Portunus trituberculatus TaxID=210409 RepID=A0A5B7DS05_PORTR|nr:Zinc finger protein 596 [Portunus trituberculatus]